MATLPSWIQRRELAARITTLTLEAGATELLQAMALYDRESPGARSGAFPIGR